MEILLTNKQLNTELTAVMEEKAKNHGGKLLFIIVGDLNAKAEYEENALAISDQWLYVWNSTDKKLSYEIPIKSIKTITVKRVYGNALIRIEQKTGEMLDVFRFTYSVASLCDGAAYFITRLNEGSTLEEEYVTLKSVFEKQMLICPRCNRTLRRAGATCMHCESKGKIFSKLWKYLAPQKKLLFVSLLLSAITTSMTLLPPYITKMLVDQIIPGKDAGALKIVVLVLFCTYLLQYTIGGFRGYLLRVCGDRIVAGLRNDIYKKAQYLPMRFYDKTSTGAVINRISGDTGTLQNFMLRMTQEVIVQFFLLFGIIIIMFVMNWKLTLLSLFPVPLVVTGARIFGKKIAPFYRRIWRRWTAVSSILTDTIPGIRVVKAFANEKNTVKTFERYNGEWLKTDIKAAKILNAYPVIVSFCISCGSLLIWSIGGRQVINSATTGLTVGLLVSFLSYTSMFYGPVNFFANLSDTYQSALASIERIFDIIDAEPERNMGQGEQMERVEGKIEFKNVSFSFDRIKKVLKNVSFSIEPGDIVGIVGTTGSGKSTLINLLMRYYDEYDGEILVDGKDIRSIDMESFRGHIGYVQQEPMMFRDTVFNNIAYSNRNAHIEEVIHAADVANAHGFIARQPDAYDTLLGERGVGLSGGEKQRISIARAVLKNPSILIFDEATAAVDSETEHLIQEAIERLICGRTTLMIAHRLSTLSKANKILVVDEGEIIENGTPQELMALKGKYYKLVQIQSMSDAMSKERFE